VARDAIFGRGKAAGWSRVPFRNVTGEGGWKMGGENCAPGA